jgi:hypothetical protein
MNCVDPGQSQRDIDQQLQTINRIVTKGLNPS